MRFHGHSIRAIRRALGLNVSELAQRVGIGQPHMTLIEQGKRQPSDDVAMRIGVALGLDDLRAIVIDPGPDHIPVWHEESDR